METRTPTSADIHTCADILIAYGATGDFPLVDENARESCLVIGNLLSQMAPMVERLEDDDLPGAMMLLSAHGNPFSGSDPSDDAVES